MKLKLVACAIAAATVIPLAACGSTSTTSETVTTASTSQVGGAANSGTDNGGGSAGPGSVDLASVDTVDELNAVINAAYGDPGLGLQRGHQPVEQTLIDTLGITHDEMHVRMEEQGQNLSAVADDLGVGTDTLINALVESWQPAIDNALAAGAITQDEASKYHQALVDAFTFRVTWNGSDETPSFTGV